MTNSFIHQSRIQPLNDRPVASTGRYVLYWMQQSQRADANHALAYAIELANSFKVPLLVVFGLLSGYPEANLRHFIFMLEGLGETQANLAQRGIRMMVQHGHPTEIALAASRRAAVLVCDRGYLKHQVDWRRQVAQRADCRVVQVESDVVVPVEVVSQKPEYAARTIRPKIHRHLKTYLTECQTAPVAKDSLGLKFDGLDISLPDKLLAALKVDSRVPGVSKLFRGGTTQAKTIFKEFIRNRLARYDQNSNQPQTDDISHMSPYLHFGQISPLYLALEIQNAQQGSQTARERYLEELIVRRELAINHVHFRPNYDTYDCLPAWAQKTLAEHAKDNRAYTYSRTQLEHAQTHDPYWNAAMQEMKHTGFMHNYMRMYWGKKILEWSSSPHSAFAATLAINNKYFLDGRDPNSYAGIAWIYGLHDRAWSERPVFGKIRYMAASGLERKCDIKGYVAKVEALTGSRI